MRKHFMLVTGSEIYAKPDHGAIFIVRDKLEEAGTPDILDLVEPIEELFRLYPGHNFKLHQDGQNMGITVEWKRKGKPRERRADASRAREAVPVP